MTISVLRELSGKTLPTTVKGGDHVDAVYILFIAGHVEAELTKAVRTPTGWRNPTAIVKCITPSGRRMHRLFPPGADACGRLGPC